MPDKERNAAEAKELMGRKTKIHKVVDSRLLQMNKRFSDLKERQKVKITEWLYAEYERYAADDGLTDRAADDKIVEAVLEKIEAAQIWIPDYEVEAYYARRKPKLRQRLANARAREAEKKVQDDGDRQE